jgi:hypothetical protein
VPGQLPSEVRDERCREWAAELPAILHDPQVRFAPRRAARMLGYAADTLRGTAMTPGKTPGVIARSRLASLFLGIFLVGFAALNIWAIVRAPGDGQYYLRLVAGLLFAAYFSARVARWLLLACAWGRHAPASRIGSNSCPGAGFS